MYKKYLEDIWKNILEVSNIVYCWGRNVRELGVVRRRYVLFILCFVGF